MQRAIEILKKLNQPDRVINRDRINFTRLMDKLEHPYRNFKSIHITGTNGKGSVAVKTASALQSSGLKVGLYTSPHLFSLRERIKINNEMIGRDQVAQQIIRIDQISQRQQIPLSYFEVLTAAAFCHFKQQKCDFVSLEVGLGGKNDTTNIVNPQVSVITSIAFDHMDLLGGTLELISKEKSGIIKQGRPVVLGSSAQNPTIMNYAKSQNSQIVLADHHQDFAVQNNLISTKVIEVLQKYNPNINISNEDLSAGLAQELPCRMERLDQKHVPKWAGDKQVYFDVGHNPAALDKIKRFVEGKGFRREEISVVFGSSRGKDFSESLAKIEEFAGFVYLIEANHFRAAKIRNLQSYIGFSKHPSKFRQVGDGNIQKTLFCVSSDPFCRYIIVCGSFFIMPEARGFYQPQILDNNSENINEIYKMIQN